MRIDTNLKPGITWSIVEKNDYLWFLLENLNGLCKINLKNRTAEIIELFKIENTENSLQYAGIVLINDIIVFAPFAASEIVFYNTKHNVLKYIPLINSFQNFNKDAKFIEAFSWKNYVYLLGHSFPAIIKIDIEAENIIYITDFEETIDRLVVQPEENVFFTNGYFIKDEKAYLPIGCLNAVLELDLKSDYTKVIQLGCSLDRIGVLEKDINEDIWLLGRQGVNDRLIKWDMEKNTYKEWIIPNIDKSCSDPFHKIMCLPNEIILWPFCAESIYLFDKATEKIHELNCDKINKAEAFSLFPHATTLAVFKTSEKIIFISGKNQKWYVLNTDNFTISEYLIDWDSLEKFYIERKIELERVPVFLEGEIKLSTFLKLPQSDERTKLDIEYIGEGIYESSK